MTSTKSQTRTVSSLILLSILFSITLAHVATENNYNNTTNLLPDISESTHTENGYKTNIIINPTATGIYATENGYKLDLTINPKGIGGSLKEGDYKLDLAPEKTFLETPDIAVTDASTSKSGCKPIPTVGKGCNITINIIITNEGFNFETFNLIINANATPIAAYTQITVLGKKNTTLSFTYNTTSLAYGNYAIVAHASPIAGEADTANNTRLVESGIVVTILGDINGDFQVKPYDLALLIAAYGSDPYPPNPRPWNPNCDINGDDQVGPYDLAVLIAHYGQHYP